MATTTKTPPAPKLTELPIKMIKPHPRNPRHTAAADPDMVASIKTNGILQPLVVAPHLTRAGEYVVLMGHRRLDGARKARHAVVPCIVREDLTTDAQMLEVAVVENVHREGLSPIEEAEAYAALLDLKWTQKKIAERTGRDVGVVRDRLKLLRLSKKTQDSVHVGQLTLTDALAITGFDAKTQTELTKAAGTVNFKRRLEDAKSKVRNEGRHAGYLSKVQTAGIKVWDLPKGKSIYDTDARRLGYIAEYGQAPDLPSLIEAHPDCLRYIDDTPASSYSAGSVDLYCITPSVHDDAVSQEHAERERERQEREAAAAEQEAREDAAWKVRTATVMDLIGPGLKLDPRFADVTRALLPPLLATLSYGRLNAYHDLMGIPADARWKNGGYYGIDARTRPKFNNHCADLADGKPALLGKAVFAVLVAFAEDARDTAAKGYSSSDTAVEALDYFTLLEALGWTPDPDVDAALLARLRAGAYTVAEPDADQEAS